MYLLRVSEIRVFALYRLNCMSQAEIAAAEAVAEKEREKERIRSGAIAYRIALSS